MRRAAAPQAAGRLRDALPAVMPRCSGLSPGSPHTCRGSPPLPGAEPSRRAAAALVPVPWPYAELPVPGAVRGAPRGAAGGRGAPGSVLAVRERPGRSHGKEKGKAAAPGRGGSRLEGGWSSPTPARSSPLLRRDLCSVDSPAADCGQGVCMYSGYVALLLPAVFSLRYLPAVAGDWRFKLAVRLEQLWV